MATSVSRITGSGPQMEFEFVTDSMSARQIMKLWSIAVMEAASPGRRNELSNFIIAKTKTKTPADRKSKSFRMGKTRDASDHLKRTGSLPRSRTLEAKKGRHNPPPPKLSGGRGHFTNTWSSSQTDSGILSQDSVFSFQPGPNVSPPPLPARPESSDEDDDPDYAYIDENEVKGPGNGGRRPPSPTVDDQLKEIERNIRREKKAKLREEERMRSRSVRVGILPGRDRNPASFGPRMEFIPAEPSDYIDPLPMKRAQTGLSLTQPSDDTGDYEVPVAVRGSRRAFSESDSSPLSQPVQSLSNVGLLKEPSTAREEGVPPLPPRSWRNNSSTSVNSAISSGSGSHGRQSSGVTPTVDGVDPAAAFPPRTYRSSTSSEDPVSPRTRDSLHETAIPEEPSDSTGNMTGHTSLTPPRLSVSPDKEVALCRSHSTSPPPLPPRSPMKGRVSRQSSGSSTTSTRCPKCGVNRSLHRQRVGKKASLNDQLAPHSHKDAATKGSLPDLNKTVLVPDNTSDGSRHRHSSGSPSSSVYIDTLPVGCSAANFEYLQLQEGGERHRSPTSPPSNFDSELQSQMDMLSVLTQTLDLEHVHQARKKPQGQSEEQKKLIRSNVDAALRLAQQVEADLSQPAHPPNSEVRKVHLPNGHTSNPRPGPLLMKHKTIAALPLSSTTPSPHAHKNGSVSQHLTSPPASSPPVPPRSLVSLGVADQPSPRIIRAATMNSFHPPHAPHTQTPAGTRPGFHWASSKRAPESESSTVFIHHIRRSATNL